MKNKLVLMMAAIFIAGCLQVGLGQQIVKIPSQNWDFRSGTLDNWHIMEWPENMKLIKNESATGGYYYKVNNSGKGANITTPKFLVGKKAKLYARYQRSGGSSCQVYVAGADKKLIKFLADNHEAPQGEFGLKIFDLSEFEGKNVYVGINGGTVMIDYMYVEQEVLESLQNSTYQIIEGNFTWHEAKADAEARGGHLATITSQKEDNKIKELVEEGVFYFLGGTDENQEGSWEWITGEPWAYENWKTGEPNNQNNENYLHYYKGEGWFDGHAGSRVGYILEIPEVNLESGLVAYYPFNGNANDESGNGNDGNVIGATLAKDRFGDSGKAYNFDGENDFVDLTTAQWGIEGNSARSVFAWVKTTHAPKMGMAIFSSGSTGQSHAFNIFDYAGRGIVGVMGFDNDFYPEKGVKYNDGVWRLVGVVHDGNKVATYVDGNLDNETKKTFNTIGQKNYIGLQNHRMGRFFKGQIDDVRIYNRALSPQEVTALYDLDSKPVDPKPGEPQLALGSATVVNGFVVSLEIDFGGSGYTNPPNVRILGGGGSGATAKAVVTDGIITELNVLTPGIGYTSTPVVEIDMPPLPPKQAYASVQVVNGFVVGFEITDSGRGYVEPPNISIISNSGSGVDLEAVLNDGQLSEIKVLNPGLGYSADALVQIDPPPYPPAKAAGQAEIINGFLVKLSVTDAGRGYGFPPKVTILGGGGSGATAVATIEDGKVVGLSITAAGSGYSSNPEVLIAPPQPEVVILRSGKNIKIKSTANPGIRCRLESSVDLINWITADETIAKSNQINFNVNTNKNEMKFFRVIWVD